MTNCFACGKEIIFDDDFVSKSGKKIPLSKTTKRPHRCKEKPFNKHTRRQWWQKQQRDAEENRERYQQQKPTETKLSKQQQYYQTLELSRGCTVQDLKTAWRKKMLEYHPDRNNSPDAEQKTREIIEAYENIII